MVLDCGGSSVTGPETTSVVMCQQSGLTFYTDTRVSEPRRQAERGFLSLGKEERY